MQPCLVLYCVLEFELRFLCLHCKLSCPLRHLQPFGPENCKKEKKKTNKMKLCCGFVCITNDSFHLFFNQLIYPMNTIFKMTQIYTIDT